MNTATNYIYGVSDRPRAANPVGALGKNEGNACVASDGLFALHLMIPRRVVTYVYLPCVRSTGSTSTGFIFPASESRPGWK